MIYGLLMIISLASILRKYGVCSPNPFLGTLETILYMNMLALGKVFSLVCFNFMNWAGDGNKEEKGILFSLCMPDLQPCSLYVWLQMGQEIAAVSLFITSLVVFHACIKHLPTHDSIQRNTPKYSTIYHSPYHFLNNIQKNLRFPHHHA